MILIQQRKLNLLILKLSEVSKQPFYYLLLLGSVTNGLVNSGGLGQYPPAFEGVHSASFAAIIISLYSVVGIFGKVETVIEICKMLFTNI